MPCKLILDENVYSGDLEDAQRLKAELEQRGLDVVYVGQPGAGFGRWQASPTDLPERMLEIVQFCHTKYVSDTPRMKRDQALQSFKSCMNRSEMAIPFGPRKPLTAIPPRGTDDRLIKKYAEAEDRIIVSEDLGRELESTRTDRIALSHSSFHTADEIIDRLQDVGRCSI